MPDYEPIAPKQRIGPTTSPLEAESVDQIGPVAPPMRPVNHRAMTARFVSVLNTEMQETDNPLEWLEHKPNGSWQKITLREIFDRTEADTVRKYGPTKTGQIVYPTYEMLEAVVKEASYT